MNPQTAAITQPDHLAPRVAVADAGCGRNAPGMLASLGLATLLLLSATSQAATAPSLGNAGSFAVLGGLSITNTGNTIISGDLGISPGSSITGFPPGIVTPPGTIHAADALAGSAQTDLVTAYDALAAQACDFGPFGPTDLAGAVLLPGVYCYSSSVQNSGVLTLSGAAATDVWVFRIGSTLTTGPGSSVVVTDPAQSCNVFWQVGSSATLDTTTAFSGNILALQSISMNDGASIAGRALARNGSVTLINNTTDATVCAGVPPSEGVGVFKVFSPSTIQTGDLSTLTITFTNTDAGAATLTAAFTDNLPVGVTSAGLPTTTCGGAPIATTASVTLPSGTTIPGGTVAVPGSCTLAMQVTAATDGSFLNVLPVLQTDLGDSPAVSPGATLIVMAIANVPTLSEWMMIMLTALLIIAGFTALRQSRS